jgi:hypothetical protein
VAIPAGPVLTAPQPPARDPAEEITTIQISRQQRAEIARIRAELSAARGYAVSTKETIAALIEAWKEQHQ